MKIRTSILVSAVIAVFAVTVVTLRVTYAVPVWTDSVVLNNWNVQELNDNGDFIDVMIGQYKDHTVVKLQWHSGGPGSPLAIGVDKFYYNCEGCKLTNKKNDDADKLGAVLAVFYGDIGVDIGTDISGDWTTNYGGKTANSFGKHNSRKNRDSGGTGGIDEALIFLLNGPLAFYANDTPNYATFTAHVRYGDGCSGWVSDGRPRSVGLDANCARVPEPSSVALLAIGVFVLAGTIAWRRRRPYS